MSINKNRVWIIGTVLLLVCTALLGIQWQKKQIKNLKVQYPSKMNPVFLVPGSSAGPDRFDKLIRKLNKHGRTHSNLKVTVSKHGRLAFRGHIKKGEREPFFIVAFDNNRDGYQNIKKQAVWFNIAFQALVKRYHFNRFSAVGHSNGGVILTIFMEKYLQTKVTAERLLTIATPFNLEKTTSQRTAMLKDMVRLKRRLPKKMKVYSIAGTQNYSGDGIVPFLSVNSGKYIFQNQVAGYTEIVVTGANTLHSELPDNQQIVRLIKEYVLRSSVNDKTHDQNRHLPRIK